MHRLRPILLILLFIVVYVALGTFLYPLWWYDLLFEDGFSFWYLVGGIGSVFETYYLVTVQTLIIVVAVALLSTTPQSFKLRSRAREFWRSRSFSLAVVAAILIIALVTVISIGKLESRTRAQRDLERQMEETSRTFEKTRKEVERLLELGHEQVPLLVPTSFVYLDKDTVESLYGQYEPDLVPALALEEIQQASEIKGGVSLQGYISTEAGQKELNRRVTEYRSVQKNTERKLKDLIRFLYDQNLFKTFRDIQPKSDKLSELDKASNLLVQKYDVAVNKDKLQSTREELLKEELKLIESELRNLKGLAFIEGDWSVDVQSNEYIFRRPFVNVSSAPVCEVRLSKSNVSPQYRDIVENLAKKPIRLSFFGNALVGLSDHSRTILLKPVAIF